MPAPGRSARAAAPVSLRTWLALALGTAGLVLWLRYTTVADATGFSRFPVEADDGELVGYLHIKDVLEPDEERRSRPLEDKWIRPFAPVTPDDALRDALEQLQRRGAHMARVVTTEGTTLGLATLEDVLEELVGEIRDAAHHDDGAPADAGA